MTLNDRLSWQLDYKVRLTPVIYPGSLRQLYKPVLRTLLQRKIAIGCHNPIARQNWEFAGNAYMRLSFSPSSTLPLNQGMILSEKDLKLGIMNFVEFPEFGIYPYTLQIDLAYWHDEVILEIWKYIEPV